MDVKKTQWQRQAAKRYPKFMFLGGDGAAAECWIVLARCRHQQTRAWRYWLRPNQAEAEATAAKQCSYQCTGDHAIWRLNP